MFTRNSTTLKHKISVQMAEPILSLCCMQMMCLVKIFSVYIHVHFMFEILVSAPGPVAFHFLDVYGHLYCHLSKKLFPGSLMREQMTLKVRKKTSLLVFIFIFYISLNVQRVSCSTVKYLYIHMYLSWLIYLDPQIFFSKLFINH